MANSSQTRSTGPLAIIGPGLLVAATGVGAGDLATGALTGSRLGVAVVWAVALGAMIKFVLNEGLARWQLATGSTVLEGTARHFGRAAIFAFLAYLCVWSFFVGSALMSACGVAAHAILPLGEASADKITYGMLHSAIAVVLVILGGFKLFEKVMSVCIGVMFVTVLATAIAIQPDWSAVASGLFNPTIPQLGAGGLKWTVGLMGGVGGTVTVLCYGYWIREENREGLAELRTCRLDLMTGYAATALFGTGMVILGSRLDVNTGAKSATLVVQLADQLETSLGTIGPAARIAFLIGAWGAVASSMLGVWQSVPYLFTDCFRMISRRPEPGNETAASTQRRADSSSPVYKVSLLALGTIPAVGLFVSFQQVQLAYAVVGAAFMPILAAALLFLNGSRHRIGVAGRNSQLANVVLLAVVAFFVWAGVYQVNGKLRQSRATTAAPAEVEPATGITGSSR